MFNYAIFNRSLWRVTQRLLVGAIAVLQIASMSSGHTSNGEQVDSISIVEHGLYEAVDVRLPIVRGSFGIVSQIKNASLIKSTSVIAARKMVRFGLRYVINRAPPNAAAIIRLVTRFPDGGLLDTSTGIRHFVSEYELTGQTGVLAYREFQFHEEWEIVPGVWRFEFWQANQIIGAHDFCVVTAKPVELTTSPESVSCPGRAESES